jgi:NitT/TauT family transport system ATP-binding protein
MRKMQSILAKIKSIAQSPVFAKENSNATSVTITPPVLEPTKIEPAVVVTEPSITVSEVSEVLEVSEVKSKAPLLLEAGKEVKLLEPYKPDVIVSFSQVTKAFDGKIAIKDVTFEVTDIPNQGELISIVGPSGCGKSTILRIIAGLEPQFPHTSGEALVMGKPITGPCKTRGVVDQKYSLLPNLTVVDNIAFGLKLQGTGRKERRDRAREWTKKVGLEGSENKYPHELSGGMQQRVSLAATLILEPQILLMDEPFGALDPKTRLKMQELLINLWKDVEATIFLVTHSMEEAVYLGDRIFRMESNPGRLVEILDAPRPDMSPEEMRKQPWFSEMVQELLERIEKSTGAQGALKAIQKMRESSDKREAEKHIGEIDILKLIS